MDAIQLAGGYINSVCRVGDTVRRPQGPRAAFVHELFLYFEQNGIDGAPRFLGIDEEDREVLSYIEGYCPHDGADQPDGTWSDASLAKVFRMLRTFHDATSGSNLAGDQEVVLYGDLAPRNTIYREGSPVAFIDWDNATPGRRITDVAKGIWQYLDLGSLQNRDIHVHCRTIPMLCDAYGLDNRHELVKEIIGVQSETLSDLTQQLNGEIPRVHMELEKAVASVARERQWVIDNRQSLEGCLLVADTVVPRSL